MAPSAFCPPAGSPLAVKPSDPHCGQVHAEGRLQLAQKQLPQRAWSSPAFTSPLPFRLAVIWMLFFASWFGATQTATTARLWSGRKEKGTGSAISSQLLGKQQGIGKRKCKWCCIHRLPIDLPGERGMCKHTAALRIACQSR